MELPWKDHVLDWLGLRSQSRHSAKGKGRAPTTHVIVLDGTMSTLTLGMETNAGLTYRLLTEMSPQVSLFYEAGIQWQDWRSLSDVTHGRGLNRQIRRAYGYLASRYKPGDRIFLFGYSRGAFAVRSLAGVIDRIGLLKASDANVRNIRQLYRIYRRGVHETDMPFLNRVCLQNIEIEMIGVWDTVKALGNRLPYLAAHADKEHDFHSHHLGRHVRHGYHALALDETRTAFTPILWESNPDYDTHLEQVWFRGSHGDVGGQLGGFLEARPLSNIPLVWMLENAEGCGLPLPSGWRRRFPTSMKAPSVGAWRGWGKIFLSRSPRIVGADPSERLHDSIRQRQADFQWASQTVMPPPMPSNPEVRLS